MTESNGSGQQHERPTLSPDLLRAMDEHDKKFAEEHPEITKRLKSSGGSDAQFTVKAFGQLLRRAWLADLESEPEPAMSQLAAASVRVLTGGATWA